MAPSSAGFVTALTAAALATVGFLGYQAYATSPAHLAKARTNGTPAITTKTPGAGRTPHSCRRAPARAPASCTP